jgi:hypothetical protein
MLALHPANRQLILRTLLALDVLAGTALAQVQFSADVVNLANANNPFQTKVFAIQDKLRFQQEKDSQLKSIMIVNLAAGTSIVLMPQQHLYVEQSRPQIPGQGVTFFQPKDVNDGCGEWRKVARSQIGKCRKIGSESVNGRDTLKYESVSKGETTYVWLDTKLHFPVKWQGPVSTSELRNIHEGPQPAELFEIPAGYTRRTFAKEAPPKSQPNEMQGSPR